MPIDTSSLRGNLIEENQTINVAGGADVTLSGQARYRPLTFTGLLTANININFPLSSESAGKIYNISNQTTGPFTLSVGILGGTMLQVPQGLRADVKWMGAAFSFADGVTQRVTVALTSAQVKALRATPITLVAAQGAGTVLEFVSAELFLDYAGTNAFTESGNNLAIRYTDGSGVIVSQAIEMTGFIDQTADTATNALPKIDAIAAKTGCDNQALVLHNTSGAEIAGNAGADNALRLGVVYRIHSPSW